MPAWCTFDARIALYPGTRPADAMAEIESCIADAARRDPYLANQPPEVEFNGFAAEGYVLQEGSAAEATLAAVHRAVTGGEDLSGYVMPAYLDARVFALYAGMPALVYGPRSRNIHGFDEAVELDSVRRVTEAIRAGLPIGQGTGPTDHFFFLRRPGQCEPWVARLAAGTPR